MTTLPLAPGACGQPPMPPSDASKLAHAASSAATTVGEAEAARVVEVGRAGLGAEFPRCSRLNSRLTCAGLRVADGVGEADGVGAGLGRA